MLLQKEKEKINELVISTPPPQAPLLAMSTHDLARESIQQQNHGGSIQENKNTSPEYSEVVIKTLGVNIHEGATRPLNNFELKFMD